MTREPIFVALMALLSGVAGFTSVSRRVKHWDDVPASQQPALFIAQRGEMVNPLPNGLPSRYVIDVDLIVYARTPDSTTAQSTVMNPLLDAITAALAPNNPIGTQTLGATVDHAWIEGKIETDEGALQDQSVAIVPVRILIT